MLTYRSVCAGASAVACALVTLPALAAGKPPPPIIVLEVQAPRTLSILAPPLESISGWPIVLRATAFNALGVAGNRVFPEYPRLGSAAYVVLADPDNCPEMSPPGSFNRLPECETTPSDETYMAFYADVDLVGTPDNTGDPDLRVALADPTVSGEPQFLTQTAENPAGFALRPIGPPTGDGVDDGIGYGANDDWPSLVLLSPHGNGLVLNTDFSRPTVRTQRNLAGFLNWTAYELRDQLSGTAVLGGGVVPAGLIAPLMMADDCIDTIPPDGVNCSGASYRIDGGPAVGETSVAQRTYPGVFNAINYELRAFVVSGIAPSELSDANGDGKVTAQDAKLAGFKVISNEVVFKLRQFHGDTLCSPQLDNVFHGDIDGNGRTFGVGTICPTGPGQIKKPPQ